MTSVHEASIFPQVVSTGEANLRFDSSFAEWPIGFLQGGPAPERTLTSLSILPGTVEFLALGALARGGRMHGFEVLRWIGEATSGELLPEEGALYPALHRMERRRWLRGTWGISEKGRRAKFYEITARGRTALSKSTREWNRYVSAVGKVVIAREDG